MNKAKAKKMGFEPMTSIRKFDTGNIACDAWERTMKRPRCREWWVAEQPNEVTRVFYRDYGAYYIKRLLND